MTGKKSKLAANSGASAPRGKPWPKGVSGNPTGRPKTGESWAELIKSIGDLTPKAAAEKCKSIAGQLSKLGDAVTLKEAVVLSVYNSLCMDPQAGLLNAFMDRAEGKVSQPIDLTWRAPWVELIRANRVTFEQVAEELDPSLAHELFAEAGVPVAANAMVINNPHTGTGD